MRRLRIAIERDQPALRPQALEDQLAVAAPAEGAVHVDAVRPDGHGFDGFRGEYGKMHRASQRKAFDTSGWSRLAGQRLAELRGPYARIPQLEVASLPDHHRVALELGVLAQRRR
jgi:hypothetical protein